ncbi:MAG: Gfo/Idh/MocA family oxidoreductase [Spirochaetales bacterium]|nr:Gfo/Idh/MocA family oxidoreductase [Spirochaetales bacterium]
MDKVRIGIIGFGHMGNQHSTALLADKVPNARLSAIADIDPKKLEKAKALAGDKVSYFNSAQELMDSGLVDAVIPTCPHYWHTVYGIYALEHGLHYLCEKPAGVYTNAVKKMNEVASKSDRVFGVMFNQRTNPLYQKARDLVQGGELGRILHCHWLISSWFRPQSYYDNSDWRATWKGEGGGLLMNQNPHNLDLWQWICGMPSRVKATVYYGKYRNIEVEDDVYALMEYPDGHIGTYVTTIADEPGTNRLEISGTRGKLVVENDSLSFWRCREDTDDFQKRFKGEIGHPEIWKCEVPVKGTYTSHCGIIKNFCEAIQKGTPLLAPGTEGINSLEIINAILLSSWEGGSWVDLPVDGDRYEALLRQKCGGKFIFEE